MMVMKAMVRVVIDSCTKCPWFNEGIAKRIGITRLGFCKGKRWDKKIYGPVGRAINADFACQTEWVKIPRWCPCGKEMPR